MTSRSDRRGDDADDIVTPEFRMRLHSGHFEILPDSDTTQLVFRDQGANLADHCQLFVPTWQMREFIALLTEAMDWLDAGACDVRQYARRRR